MEELIKVLAKIISDVSDAKWEKYSFGVVTGLLFLFFLVVVIMSYLSYGKPEVELFSKIGEMSFIIFSILCFLFLIAFWALRKVKQDEVDQWLKDAESIIKETSTKEETKDNEEKIKKFKKEFEEKKEKNLNQEEKLMLILKDPSINNQFLLWQLKEIYQSIFDTSIDWSVFYWLKNEKNPGYSLLRWKNDLSPFISYDRGVNVSLTDEWKKYTENKFPQKGN